VHLKKAGRLRAGELETFGLGESISCFHFLLFLDQPTHCRLTGYIPFFLLLSHCIRMSVYSLRSTCLFPYMPPHLVNFFFFHYPPGHRRSHLLYCVFFVRRAAFSIPLPLFLLFLGFRFLMGMGGSVWRMDGLAWLCKSGFREEFVLGKGVMHGRLG